MRAAWRCKFLKLWRKQQVGSSMSMLCSLFIPSPELMKTILVKRGGRWLTPKYCESVRKNEELDEQFFDDGAVIPSMAMSQRRQKIWDSLHQDTRSLKIETRQRRKWRSNRRDYPYTQPEKAVEDQKRVRKKKIWSVSDVEKVLLVNGVELTKGSTLATLRAACSFLGVSGSG